MSNGDTKVCVSCGREFSWRKKWERTWDDVKYCSGGCRQRGVQVVDVELETAILALLDQRSRSTTICPSEAARQVAGDTGVADDRVWRELMEPARAAARRLVASGEVEITQQGRVVDPSTAKGPVRIRRR